MAKIWQNIELDWNKKTYTIKPTLDLINLLEQRSGCSLSALMIRMSNRDLPSGAAAEIVAKTLNYAGVKDGKKDVTVTPEDVFEAYGAIGLGITVAASKVLVACLPQPKASASKKDKAPEEKKGG